MYLTTNENAKATPRKANAVNAITSIVIMVASRFSLRACTVTGLLL